MAAPVILGHEAEAVAGERLQKRMEQHSATEARRRGRVHEPGQEGMPPDQPRECLSNRVHLCKMPRLLLRCHCACMQKCFHMNTSAVARS